LCLLWETACGDPLDPDALLALVVATGHPEAEDVAAAVGGLAESVAMLTAAQAVELKVALWRSSPQLWCTVRMPMAVPIGDLHRAIQVLFGWDGDHLYTFTVAGTHYGDPPFDLEETADEEAVRLRDAFLPAPASRPGTSNTSVSAGSTRSPAPDPPASLRERPSRCLSFSGDNPVEYWHEDDPVEPSPFDRAEVNSKLAG
jgi:hypothetical protein